ncbi:hypothetical protein OIV83_005768 [Microbotryomycetes sp. JL201]|nr:hypothetical protein OIV83_005768 [Microbotryomycetes sp. JL201]
MSDVASDKVQATAKFVLEQLEQHRQSHNVNIDTHKVRPLVVGVQGPQGAGKSHLTGLLPAYLSSAPFNLTCASVSLDDLYLPYDKMTRLGRNHPDNKLLQGRGQPGTHDLLLGRQILEKLSNINGSSNKAVEIPIYDKSLHAGLGDRTGDTVKVIAPIDIVIFEGWMNGFHSLPTDTLDQWYKEAQQDPVAFSQARKLDYQEPFFVQHSLDSLKEVNDMLGQYERDLWTRIDCFIEMRPVEMGYVWQWRLQQEHNMMAQNGGVGMTDEQVKDFIARYMPGYELFLDGIERADAPWHSKGLRLVIGQQREIVATETF